MKSQMVCVDAKYKNDLKVENINNGLVGTGRAMTF